MNLTFAHDTVLRALQRPRWWYFVVLLFLGGGISAFALCFLYQVLTGMGVTGLSIPVCWATYITNFVWWVGIAHSGTLISAILFLMRAKWRNSVSRAAEAMTVFAVLCAGMFPLIHLGRFWVFYYILPYPSQRQLWPNFQSPLVMDVVAVTTYLTVSIIFFYVGLIPDLSAARDHYESSRGMNHWRSRLYRVLSLGWSNSSHQWHHYGRAYLFFAALATPLVVSVHSVVSWDFATSLLPGWHSTIFPPYFVAGAIHSGLAMVLTLIIPMRRILGLDTLVKMEHLDAVARTMIVTSLIVGYAYIIEPFIAWYSGDVFEQQFAYWRATGSMSPIYWALMVLNVLCPLLFVFRKFRANLRLAFLISILVNVGMWLERYFIIVTSLKHDFLPHNWGAYLPSWVELTISAGVFCFFFFMYLLFSKLLPVIPISEINEHVVEEELKEIEGAVKGGSRATEENGNHSSALKLEVKSTDPSLLLRTLERLKSSGCTVLDVFSPVKLEIVGKILKYRPSPVRRWTLAGTVVGAASGFALSIYTAEVNNLIVGGKFPISIIPYCVIGFECAVLLGSLVNLAALIVYSRLYRKRSDFYRPEFSKDTFGIVFQCDSEKVGAVRSLVEPLNIEVANGH